MAHHYSFHRGKKYPRQSLVRYRQLLQVRSFAVTLPLLGCLLFSCIYGVQHTNSVANHAKTIAQSSTVNTTNPSNLSAASSQVAKSIATDTSSNSLASPSGSAVPSSQADSTPKASTQTNVPITNKALNPLTKTAILSCDGAAKTLATTVEQTAINLENTRHAARVSLLTVDNIATMLNQNSTALNAENSLYTNNLQKIENAYKASLLASNCL